MRRPGVLLESPAARRRWKTVPPDGSRMSNRDRWSWPRHR